MLKVNFTLEGQLVLDASAVINLLACGRTTDFINALGMKCVAEERTIREVIRHPIPSKNLEETMDKLFTSNLLTVVRMNDAEYELYTDFVTGNLATALDDGESAAIAIAAHRNLPLVIDDKKARTLFTKRFPAHSYMSSLCMLVVSGQRLGIASSELKASISSARKYARMNVVRGERDLLESLGL